MTDWRAWHEEYDDPGSRLSRRLEVVRARLSEILDGLDAPAPRLLALCAGDARDVVPVLRSRPNGDHVAAVLVEIDEMLAERARASARAVGLRNVEVRSADAGDPESFRDVLPVDVLMLCGIFGNVEPSTVRHIARRVPAMVRSGGAVIWTRGGEGPDDPRPQVRRWFIDAGMSELSFDGPPETYGVGVNRVERARPIEAEPARLFTFV